MIDDAMEKKKQNYKQSGHEHTDLSLLNTIQVAILAMTQFFCEKLHSFYVLKGV